MTEDDKPTPTKTVVSALFATIHFRSEQRPDGYSDDDIAELNKRANVEKSPPEIAGDDPA